MNVILHFQKKASISYMLSHLKLTVVSSCKAKIGIGFFFNVHEVQWAVVAICFVKAFQKQERQRMLTHALRSSQHTDHSIAISEREPGLRTG